MFKLGSHHARRGGYNITPAMSDVDKSKIRTGGNVVDLPYRLQQRTIKNKRRKTKILNWFTVFYVALTIAAIGAWVYSCWYAFILLTGGR